MSYLQRHPRFRQGLWPALRVNSALECSAALFMGCFFATSSIYYVSLGMSAAQLVWIGTTLELTVFVLELPTGILADRVSRKLSLLLGYALLGGGFLMQMIAEYWAIFAAQVVVGAGYTLISGAQQAWLHDEVGEQAVAAGMMRGARYQSIGQVLALPLAMLSGFMLLRIPMLIGGLGLLLTAGMILLCMGEQGFEPQAHSTESKNPLAGMGRMLKQSRLLLKGSASLMLLLLISLFIGLYSEGVDRLSVAHLTRGFGFFPTLPEIVFFGLMSLVGSGGKAVVMWRLERVIEKASRRTIRNWMTLGYSVTLLCILAFALVSDFWYAAVAMVVLQVFRGIGDVTLDILYNRAITDSQVRATMFSLRGQADSIGQVGSGMLIGMIAFMGIVPALLCSAALLLPAVILSMRLFAGLSRTEEDSSKC